MAKGKMGRMYTRQNSKHETGAANEHIWIRIEDEDGSNEAWARFSEKDIARAKKMARKNIEDAPAVGFITDLLD